MKYLLLFITLVMNSAHADEIALDNYSFETVEAERLIVNWQPTDTRLGTMLVYRCTTCDPIKMSFYRDTEFRLQGKLADITVLKNKVDWSGHIKFTEENPERIIRINIIEPTEDSQ
ncbi:hypothetical protein [Metapseudomonas otitidis]|uniref:hypothetical protein n=1 Tax=Metapseudomonas otitidis TaxID=319939 RepID=UPI002446B211|nr:hypothetical protein [Pseudomonas otitidis]MDH0336614.1 hypothetical protein [Pseudomonas otitidis]